MIEYTWSSLTSDGDKVVITCHPIDPWKEAAPIELVLDYSNGTLQELISTLQGVIHAMDIKKRS